MTKRFELPQQERLSALFDYDPETGVVTAKTDRPSRRGAYKQGDRIGYLDAFGYLKVTVDGKPYALHRVIWKLMTGDEPPAHLDHINCVRHDNRWPNLRKADKSTNAANARISRANTSGVKGVRLASATGRWNASVTRNGVARHLGSFTSRDEAAEAYRKGAEDAFGEFARTGEGPQRVVFDVVELADDEFMASVVAAVRRLWSYKLTPGVPADVVQVLDDIGLDLSTQLARVSPARFGNMRVRASVFE